MDTVRDNVIKEAKHWHEKYNKPVLMSEYGADTIAGLHIVSIIISGYSNWAVWLQKLSYVWQNTSKIRLYGVYFYYFIAYFLGFRDIPYVGLLLIVVLYTGC